MELKGDTNKPLSGSLTGLWRYRIGDYRLIFRLYPRFLIRENNINLTYSELGTIITVYENLQESAQEYQRHQLRGKSYP